MRRLGDRCGYKFPMTLGMVLTAVGLVLLAAWHHRPWQVVLGITIAGGSVPFSWGAMTKLVVDAVEPGDAGIASGVNPVMRLVGGVVRSELAATVLANRTIPGTTVRRPPHSRLHSGSVPRSRSSGSGPRSRSGRGDPAD
jgi:MFS family permease